MKKKINFINLLCDQIALPTAMEALVLWVLQPDMTAVLRYSPLRSHLPVGGSNLQDNFKNKSAFPTRRELFLVPFLWGLNWIEYKVNVPGDTINWIGDVTPFIFQRWPTARRRTHNTWFHKLFSFVGFSLQVHNCSSETNVISFRFMWPCIINVGEERTNGWHK